MIRAVVFDVGWVLVRLDYRPLLGYVTAAGIELGEMRELTARIGLESHERGELSGEALLANILALAPDRMDRDRLAGLWIDMFEPVGEMFDLARSLAERYRVYLLSNVGDLHWAHLVAEYGLDRLGHGALPSFVAGYMKPDRRIYEEAVRRFALEPARTVFIDDLEPNVLAARSAGWLAIRHQTPQATVAELRKLGIRD